VPAKQVVHFTATAAENVPAAQSLHPDEPFEDANFPAEHVSHAVVEPVADLNSPVSQSVQLVALLAA